MGPNVWLSKLPVNLILGITIFLLAFGATGYRLSQAPDIFVDEIVYTRLGSRVAGEGAVVWDSGEPFVVHPPLYFLVEGLFFRLSGKSTQWLSPESDIFSAVYYTRYLNVFFAALTAVLLFVLGGKLGGYRRVWLVGLLFAALFIFDPFGVRINRRAMLETLAALFSLAGISLLLINNLSGHPRYYLTIGAGLFLGAALLTKELTLITIAVVVFCGFWELWITRSYPHKWPVFQDSPAFHYFLAVLIAIGTYGLNMLWIVLSGSWTQYYYEKVLGIERLLGLRQLTGWNRPGLSLTDFLLRRLPDYGSSYLLLALGGVATLWILLFAWKSRTGRMLGVWGLVYYPFFAFLALVGSGNDQFFYFILIPSIVLTIYAFTMKIQQPSLSLPTLLSRRIGNRISINLDKVVAGKGRMILLAVFLILMIAFNTTRWWSKVAVGQDNGYYQLTRFVNKTIPATETVNASGDATKLRYFLYGRPTAAAATPEEAQALGIHYFVLAPRDVDARYGKTQPELANWIQTQGIRLLALESDSYGDIYLYKVDYIEDKSLPPTNVDHNTAHWRSFNPPEGGYIGSLVFLLVFWVIGLAGFTLFIYSKKGVTWKIKHPGEKFASLLNMKKDL